MTHDVIRASSQAVATGIRKLVEQRTPDRAELQDLAQQLLQRHALLGLQPVVSSEEIVEAHLRCLITDGLTGLY